MCLIQSRKLHHVIRRQCPWRQNYLRLCHHRSFLPSLRSVMKRLPQRISLLLLLFRSSMHRRWVPLMTTLQVHLTDRNRSIFTHHSALDLKPLDVPLVFQPVSSSSISLKEANEHGSPSSTSTKRPHSDENTEAAYISSTISDTDEQLSPLKRVRRSMSSQESIDTLR